MQAEAEDFSDRERQGTFQLDIIEKELKHAEAHKKAMLLPHCFVWNLGAVQRGSETNG